MAVAVVAMGVAGVIPAAAQDGLYIKEYRVEGAAHLPRRDVERAVYRYLGPGRSDRDVEQARVALEKAYRDNGFQTVSVQVPQQQVRDGVVVLQVTEMTVGRFRVKNSRYFLPSDIKKQAPSLKEGVVMDFNAVSADIVALNRNPDLQVTPSMHAGVEANTVDVDLDVKDSRPLHGSVELNNHYSSETTPLRLNAAIRYDNLWQLYHSIGGSFQVAPEDVSEVKVFSAFYTARFSQVPELSLTLQGTKQDSNVSSLGSTDVVGKGEYVGPHVTWVLPNGKEFYHSVNAGIDYKHFENNVTASGVITQTPITYWPFSVGYGATWMKRGAVTEFNAALNMHFRGMGDDPTQFDNNRYNARSDYIYFRGDLSHTHDLPVGFQVFGKMQGQISDQPLISNEQFSAGGWNTVRGYLESAAMGDNALVGSVELRSPSFGQWVKTHVDEWRVYIFAEGGALNKRNPLPEEEAHYSLASWGVGSRMRVSEHFNGSFDLGIPLIGVGTTTPHDLLYTFRLWADF